MTDEKTLDQKIPVWELRHLDGSSPDGQHDVIVAYHEPIEDEYVKLVPIGVGWRSLLDWLDGSMDDANNCGEGFEIRLAYYGAAELAEIDTGV